jgi:hypothetical protein
MVNKKGGRRRQKNKETDVQTNKMNRTYNIYNRYENAVLKISIQVWTSEMPGEDLKRNVILRKIYMLYNRYIT